MPFRSIFDFDSDNTPGNLQEPSGSETSSGSVDGEPSHAQVLFGKARANQPDTYVSDYDRPLVDGIWSGMNKLRTATDPEDAWQISRDIEEVRDNSPHLEPHLPDRAFDLPRAVRKGYDDEAGKFALAGANETPDDRARFRRAGGVAGLDWFRQTSAAPANAPSQSKAPDPSIPPPAAAAATAVALPGAQAAGDGRLVFRPQPGGSASGLNLGDIAGGLAKGAVRHGAKAVPGVGEIVMLLETLSPSPTAERRIIPLGDDLRFSGMNNEFAGSLQRRDPATGQWNQIGLAEVRPYADGDRIVRTDQGPNVTPPSPPVALPDRQITVPPRRPPAIPGFPAEPQVPGHEEFPEADRLPDRTVFPDDHDEFSEAEILEHRRLDDPIPLGQGRPLPEKTVQGLATFADKKWRSAIEKSQLASGDLDGYGSKTTNVTRHEGTAEDARRDFNQIVKDLGGSEDKLTRFYTRDAKTGRLEEGLTYSPDDRHYVKVRMRSTDGRPTVEVGWKVGEKIVYTFKTRYGTKLD